MCNVVEMAGPNLQLFLCKSEGWAFSPAVSSPCAGIARPASGFVCFQDDAITLTSILKAFTNLCVTNQISPSRAILQNLLLSHVSAMPQYLGGIAFPFAVLGVGAFVSFDFAGCYQVF